MSKTLGGYQERTRKNRDVSRDRTSSLVKFTRTTVGKSTFATSRTWKHGGRNLIPSGSGTPFMRAKLCQNVDWQVPLLQTNIDVENYSQMVAFPDLCWCRGCLDGKSDSAGIQALWLAAVAEEGANIHFSAPPKKLQAHPDFCRCMPILQCKVSRDDLNSQAGWIGRFSCNIDQQISSLVMEQKSVFQA